MNSRGLRGNISPERCDAAHFVVFRSDGDKQEVIWIVDDLPVPARILRRKGGEDEMDLRLTSVH